MNTLLQTAKCTPVPYKGTPKKGNVAFQLVYVLPINMKINALWKTPAALGRMPKSKRR